MSDQSANIAGMLGEKKLKVIWNGQDYFIRTMDSLSPEEFMRVMLYGKKFSGLTDKEIEIDKGKSVVMAIDDVIAIIGPDFPKHRNSLMEKIKAFINKQYLRRFDMSLEDCISILQFWTANNPKKAVRTVGKQKRKKR